MGEDIKKDFIEEINNMDICEEYKKIILDYFSLLDNDWYKRNKKYLKKLLNAIKIYPEIFIKIIKD